MMAPVRSAWLLVLLASQGHAVAQGHIALGVPHPSSSAARYAYDSARGRPLMFVGSWLGHDGTFEWEDSGWTLRRSDMRPAVSSGYAIAFDSGRERLVLFGGYSGATPVGTWEWDGHEWMQRTTANSPSPRRDHAMGYDAARARCVLFGGYGLNDTWEYDGTNWTQRFPSVSPPSSAAPVVAYDPGRQRTVLCSGNPPGLWEWNGTNWTNVMPAGFSVGLSPAVAYDASRASIVVLSSSSLYTWDGQALQPLTFSYVPNRSLLDYDAGRGRLMIGDAWETWVESGSTFLRAAVHQQPYGKRIVYDSLRRRAICYSSWYMSQGGPSTIYYYSGVIHEWDGSHWIAGAWGPDRGDPLVAFDAAHGYMLVHGGMSTSGLSDETWTWDGTNWTNRSGTVRPLAYDGDCMAADTVRQEVILYSGTTSPATWRWNGASWALASPAHNPGIRTGASLVEDPHRQRLVLFGGLTLAAGSDETWEWDGVDWQLRSPTHRPPGRRQATAFYDSTRRCVALHGGRKTNTGIEVADDWEWDGTDWSPTIRALVFTGNYVPATFLPDTGQVLTIDTLEGPLVPAASQSLGHGCGGITRPPRLLTNTPYMGQPAFSLEIVDLAPSVPLLLGWSLQPSNQALPCGCGLYLADPIDLIPLAASPSGRARLGFPIPAAASLRSLSLHVQAVAIDPLGVCAPVALTQAVSLRFGD